MGHRVWPSCQAEMRPLKPGHLAKSDALNKKQSATTIKNYLADIIRNGRSRMKFHKLCFCSLFIFEMNESLILIIDKLRSTSFSLTGILQSIFFCFEQMDSKSIQSIPLFFSSLLIISL